MEKTTEIKEQEYMGDTTNIIDELISTRKEIISIKMTMDKINSENNEIKKDTAEMKRELNINKMCYENGFYGNEKAIIQYLLQGETSEEMINAKFKVLVELIEIYQKVSAILGDLTEDVEEEENETIGENENNE